MSGIYTNSLLNSSANMKTLDSYIEKATDNFEAILEFNDDIFVADLIATRDFYKGLLESGEYVLNEGVFSAISALIQKIILAIKDAFNYIVNAVSTRKGKNKTFDKYKMQIALYDKRVGALAKQVNDIARKTGKIGLSDTIKYTIYHIPSNKDSIRNLFEYETKIVVVPPEEMERLVDRLKVDTDNVESLNRVIEDMSYNLNKAIGAIKSFDWDKDSDNRSTVMYTFYKEEKNIAIKDLTRGYQSFNVEFFMSGIRKSKKVEELDDYRTYIDPLNAINAILPTVPEDLAPSLRGIIALYGSYLREITNKVWSYYNHCYQYTLLQCKERYTKLVSVINKANGKSSSNESASIEKQIKNCDANCDEQKDSQKSEFGPSDGVDDILDESSSDAKQVDMKHDANEDEQNNAKDAEFGPDDDVDKILDEFFSDVYADNSYEYDRVLMEYEILADKYEARWNRMDVYKKAIIEEAKIRANPDANVLYEAAVVSKAAQTAASGALAKELGGVLGKIVTKIKEIFNKFMEKLRASSPYTRTYLNKYKDIILRNKLPERSYDCKDLINGMHRVINYSIPAFNYNEIKDSLDSYATFFDKIRGTGTNFDKSFNGASVDPRTENTTKSIATYFKEYFGMTNEDTTHSAEEFERNMKDIYDFMYDVNKIEKSIKDDIRRVEAMQTNAAKQAGVPTSNGPTPAEDTVNARNQQNRQQQQEGYFSYMDNLEYLLEIKAKEDPNNMTGKVAGSVTNVRTDKNATAQNQYGGQGTPLDELNAKLKVYGEVTTAVLTAKLTAVEYLRNEFMWLFRHMVSRYVQGEQEPAPKTQAPARNTPEFVNTVRRGNQTRQAQQ